MKKALLIISLGISLITVGAIVTAYEVSNWKIYDIEKNVSNFPIETVEETFEFDKLETDSVVISNNMFIGDYFDYDEYYGYEFLYENNNTKETVEIIEDDSQQEGTFNISMDYINGLGTSHCVIKSNSRVQINQDHSRIMRPFRNNSGKTYAIEESSGNQRNKEFATYIHPECMYYPTSGFDVWKMLGTDGIINMLKNKEIPIVTNKIRVYVHPNDAHKIYK